MIEITELQSPSLDRAMEAHEFWTELAIMEFSRGVRKMLRRRGMNQRALASELSYSEAYVSKVLGRENITINQMQKILHPLGATVHIVVADRENVVRCREVHRDEMGQTSMEGSLGLGGSPLIYDANVSSQHIQSAITA